MKKQKDFFSLYHSSQLQRYLVPGALALTLALGVVGIINGDVDMRGLMANVSNVSRGAQYDADLILTQKSGILEAVLGANADGVDRVEFTLLSDPTRFRSLTALASDTLITAQPELGTYRVSVNVGGKSVKAGTILTKLSIDIDPQVSIAVTDVAFVSGEDRYNLTSKVQ